MGFDSLRDLPGWHEPARLVAACHLVALTRHDIELDWGKLEAALSGIRQRVTILDMPELEIASNQIQARVRAGRSIRYLVPDEVRSYIVGEGLYTGRMTNDAGRISEWSVIHPSSLVVRLSLLHLIRHVGHDDPRPAEQRESQPGRGLRMQQVGPPALRHELRHHNRDRLVGLALRRDLLDIP